MSGRRGNPRPDPALGATGIAGFRTTIGTRRAPSTAGDQDPTWIGKERAEDSAILSEPATLAQESSLETITDTDDVDIPTAGKLRDAFAHLLGTERRLLIEVVPETWIPCDAAKMMQASIPAWRKLGLLK